MAKLKTYNDKIDNLEKQLAGVRAQAQTSVNAMNCIQKDKIDTLRYKAVDLLEQEPKIKTARLILERIANTKEEDCFFGAKGYGDTTIMRTLTDLHLVGDARSLVIKSATPC